MTYRLGVDVGGTFTDVLLVEEASGATWRAKTASTPSDQAVGVRNGIAKVCDEAGIALSDVAQVLHGTTVATNAILEYRGARTGLITTKGFRDILEIGRQIRARLYDVHLTKPRPLVSRRWSFGIRERLDAEGRVLEPLDVAAVRQAV